MTSPSMAGTRSGCTIALFHYADGLIDTIMGFTAITISNIHFSHHNDVMLLRHNDDYLLDTGMQVTITFNCFREELVQRMPRYCQGYFNVVNNDFTSWEMYAIGSSANPTINSPGNRYIAPPILMLERRVFTKLSRSLL